MVKKLFFINKYLKYFLIALLFVGTYLLFKFVLYEYIIIAYKNNRFEVINIIISVLGFLLALFVTLNELNRFYRNKKLSELSTIKNLLVRTQSTLQYIRYKLNTYVDEACFIITKEFYNNIKDIKINDNLDESLNDDKIKDYLFFTLTRVSNEIEIKQKILAEINELKKVLFKYQASMPIVITIINESLTIIRNVFDRYTNLLGYIPIHHIEQEITHKELKENILSKIKNLDKYNEVTVKGSMNNLFRKTLKHYIYNKLIYIFGLIQEITGIITDLILEINEKELIKLQEWDKKQFNSTKKNQREALNLTISKQSILFESLQSLVVNWMLYKEQKERNKNFAFKLGCIKIRRIINHICEEEKEPIILQNFIDRYLDDLSMSSGTSERDNILAE